jgi:hypothetical protein
MRYPATFAGAGGSIVTLNGLARPCQTGKAAKAIQVAEGTAILAATRINCANGNFISLGYCNRLDAEK